MSALFWLTLTVFAAVTLIPLAFEAVESLAPYARALRLNMSLWRARRQAERRLRRYR